MSYNTITIFNIKIVVTKQYAFNHIGCIASLSDAISNLRMINGFCEEIAGESNAPFNFEKGSVALARTQKYNTEDSQFFVVLRNEPLYETEYTPIGKVIYGIEVLEKIKYLDKSEYVLRPDFINSLRLFN